MHPYIILNCVVIYWSCAIFYQIGQLHKILALVSHVHLVCMSTMYTFIHIQDIIHWVSLLFLVCIRLCRQHLSIKLWIYQCDMCSRTVSYPSQIFLVGKLSLLIGEGNFRAEMCIGTQVLDRILYPQLC